MGVIMHDEQSALAKSLRANKDARRIELYNGDAKRPLKVKPGRNAVQMTLKVVGKLTWTRAELFDEDGVMLDAVTNDGPADGVEDIGTHDRKSRDERMADLILRVVDRTMSARTAETAQAMTAMSAAMQRIADSAATLAGLQNQSIDAALQLAQFQPPPLQLQEGAAPESASSGALKAIAPMILARLIGIDPGMMAGLAGAMAGFNAAPPPPVATPANGAGKKE